MVTGPIFAIINNSLSYKEVHHELFPPLSLLPHIFQQWLNKPPYHIVTVSGTKAKVSEISRLTHQSG